jgi:hypothetical protein
MHVLVVGVHTNHHLLLLLLLIVGATTTERSERESVEGARDVGEARIVGIHVLGAVLIEPASKGYKWTILGRSLYLV